MVDIHSDDPWLIDETQSAVSSLSDSDMTVVDDGLVEIVRGGSRNAAFASKSFKGYMQAAISDMDLFVQNVLPSLVRLIYGEGSESTARMVRHILTYLIFSGSSYVSSCK